jgi:predicted DNA-binding transcriptional regulator YafY
LLDARFSPLEDKDIDDWVKSAFLLEHGEREEQVEIIFSKDAARYIRERRWHPSQELQENEDGSCSLKFITQSVDEVRRWVLTYGAQAEVIKPLELRELLRSDALALVQKYGTEKVAST